MLNCEDEDNSVPDQYAFVMPESWLIFQSGESVELGQSVEFSGTCNPNFEAWLTCENAQDYNLCTLSVQAIFNYGTYNENNHFETFLQCPQCGCGAQGAVNINDLYAAEQAGSRKVTDDETLLNKISFK